MRLRTIGSSLLTAGFICLPALAAGPVGWRTDGTGRYGDASPVKDWSPEKNVVWRAEMPKWSNATPVVLEDRVFVCAEPTDLVCVSKSDGKILWTKTNTLEEAMTDADRAEAAELAEKAKPVADKLAEAKKELNQLNAQKKEKPDDKDIAAKYVEQRKAVSQLENELATLSKWKRPRVQGSNGYSSPTPVSDGKHVWALYNNGVAACYDLEGNRKWIVHVDVPPHRSWGHSASPVLHDGKLIVHVANMKALDAATGKLLWTAEGTKWAWGTPFVTAVGETAVAVAPKGQIVRLSDGEVVAKVPNELTYNSAIVADGVAYCIQGKAVAVRLAPADDGGVKVEPAWTVKIKEDRYYGSPVIHKGLLYAVNQKGHLSILDTATGKVLNGEGQGVAMDLGKGTCYPSVTFAGDCVFVSSDNGTTAVLKPGPAAEVVATNKLDTFRSSPVFQGERMYVRTYKYLYCIGE